jgi:hypothetical protein
MTMLIHDFASITFVLKKQTKPSEELKYQYGPNELQIKFKDKFRNMMGETVNNSFESLQRQ